MSPETHILVIHAPETLRVDGMNREVLINVILAEFSLVGRVYVSRDAFKARLPINADEDDINRIADLYLSGHGIKYDIE